MDKKTVVPPAYKYGKSIEQNNNLLREIHAGKKYVIFHGLNGIVHIIPDVKLKEMLATS